MFLTELMTEKENTSLDLFIFCMLNFYKSCLNEIKYSVFLEVLVNVPEVKSENLFHDYLYIITYIYISLDENLDKHAQWPRKINSKSQAISINEDTALVTISYPTSISTEEETNICVDNQLRNHLIVSCQIHIF